MSKKYTDLSRYFDDGDDSSSSARKGYDRAKDRHLTKQFIHQLLTTGDDIESFDEEIDNIYYVK